MSWQHIGEAALIAIAWVVFALLLLWKSDVLGLGTWLAVREPGHRGLRRLSVSLGFFGVAVFALALVLLAWGA